MTSAQATGAAESCCASCAKKMPCETGCARHGEPQVGEDFPTPQDAIQSAVSKGFTHADIGADQQGHVYRQNPDGSTRVSRLYFNKGKYHFDYPHDVSQPIPASARPLVERRVAAEEARFPGDVVLADGHPLGRGYRALGQLSELGPLPAVAIDESAAGQARLERLGLIARMPDGSFTLTGDGKRVYQEASRHDRGVREATEQRSTSADQLQWYDAGNFYFARVPGGDYTVSKVPGVHHLAWQPHGGRVVALGMFPSPESAQSEAVRHYHAMRAAPVYQAAERREEMKLGIEPVADDYFAIDAANKVVGGPFKSISDAKSLAQRHGGYVKFVPSAGEAGEHAVGASCRPWMRMEKDVPAFNACMQLADRIGPIEGHGALHSFIRSYMERQDQECFVVVLLDTQMQIRNYSEVARGARDRVPTPVPDVARVVVAESMQFAVYYGAMGVAVSHNHPSGKCEPSDADAQVTAAMEDACRAMGVLFVDHIVVGRSSYYSFKAKRAFRPRHA